MKQKDPYLKARQEVIKRLQDNPDFSLKYLERKKKNEFSLRHEVTWANGEPLTFYEDQLKKAREEIKRDEEKWRSYKRVG